MDALLQELRDRSAGRSKPVDLSHSDHPGAQLVTALFNGDNFLSWSKGVKFTLGAKNKLGFIFGTDVQPVAGSEDEDRWIRADYMVRCWILNSMKDSIAKSFMNVTSALQLWDQISERFGESNGPLLYQLQRELVTTTQGTDSLADYFSKVKQLWDDIADLEDFTGCTCSKCTCEVNSRISAKEEKAQLNQFLMGLNDSYENIRGNILAMDPHPSLNKAYQLVQQSVRQKMVTSSPGLSHESSALNVSKGNNGNNRGGSATPPPTEPQNILPTQNSF